MREGRREVCKRSTQRLRPRSLAIVALSLGLPLAFTPSAPAAGDPVANGSVSLTLSGSFRQQLKHNGVKMQRKRFTVQRGSIDPTDGTGSLALAGKLKFKKGHKKAAFRKVTMTLGKAGALRGDGTKLFKLRGGRVSRNGFGVDIGGMKLELLRKGAKGLNRKLGLRSLRAGSAGTLSASEQPKTVQVKNGRTRVVPSIASGSVAFKLFAHCVEPISGVKAIPPAQQDSNLNFTFPAVGGTIGPNGKDGTTLHTGGAQVSKDPLQVSGSCGSVPDDVSVRLTNMQIDLKDKHVFAEAVINGYPSPLGGPKGVAITFNIDRSRETVAAHPKAHKIMIGNLDMTLSDASVIFLNLVFPNGLGDPNRDFKTTDLFGTAEMTLNTR